MDWKELGKTVTKIGAPILGTLLGGPAGASIGAMVASAVDGDASDPAALAQTLLNPEAALKVRELEANKVVRLRELVVQQATQELAADTARIESVNATMRAESASEKWPQYGWRPYWGFISGTTFLVVCSFVCYLAYKAIMGNNPNAVLMIPQLVGAFTMLFGIPAAILGVASWHRGVEKIEKVKATAGVRDVDE